MSEQIGWRGLWRELKHEAPYWAKSLPHLPRLLQQHLARDEGALVRQLAELNRHQQKQRVWLAIMGTGFAGLLLLQLFQWMVSMGFFAG